MEENMRTRASRQHIRVTFPDGKEFCYKFPDGEYFANTNSTDTFLEVVWQLGIDEIKRKATSPLSLIQGCIEDRYK